MTTVWLLAQATSRQEHVRAAGLINFSIAKDHPSGWSFVVSRYFFTRTAGIHRGPAVASILATNAE